jgi:Asp-tRNA(Asn)/Glu-tRNA(Gln) amidotransferase A subunit family amidase
MPHSASDPAIRELLTRVAHADQELDAWVCLDPAAHAAPSGPLSGLSFGVKDVLDMAGLPTRCGSPATGDDPAATDAACVGVLRAAGAVPLGKTVTAEFAHVTPGPTRNPFHRGHTPGGSSSGSAAAVGAGMVPFALGTQTGGSMIRPAAYCGVVGFKPSHGAVARDGMRIMSPTLDTIGWHAIDVATAQRVARVLVAGHAVQAMHPPRVRLVATQPGYAMSASASLALADAAAHLRAAGYDVAPGEPPAQAGLLLRAHGVIVDRELAHSLAALDAVHGGQLSARLRATLRRGMAVSDDDYDAALAVVRARRADTAPSDFAEAELILTAGALGAAPAGLAHTGESGFNKGWSVLGWPCLHLPTTKDAAGLPLGVMLVARPDADHALLQWARDLHPLIDRRGASAKPFSISEEASSCHD